MCGIAGIFNIDGKQVDASILKRMTDAIAHRGPDGEGHYVQGGIALGHRRLAIIDLSDNARQPMSNEDGTIWLTYNGEIYNFKQLRQELEDKGHRFKSKTDSEVIIHGYEEEGIDFVLKLNGMFAFALWDSSKGILHLVRDRYGIKPLYFWMNKKTLVFASEIKAILKHPLISAKLDYSALIEYFTFQNTFRYHTLFDGINLIPAACIRSISARQPVLTNRSFWDYNFTDRDHSISMEEAESRTLQLLKQAVERQLISDVPVGSYLSGGMDSGSIVAIASSQMPMLTTFTCGYDLSKVTGIEANYDERREAEIVASEFKTEHYEQVISSSDISRSLPRVVFHLEDLRLGMSYSNYYIARLASKFVKVCLSGTGGDELYGGYPWRYFRVFKSLGPEEYYRNYYEFWQRLIADDAKKDFFINTASIYVEKEYLYNIFKRVFTFNDTLKYSSPEDHIANSLYFEIKTFMSGLLIVNDKLSMANSLEERVPFLDNDLVDFALKIPIRHKLADLHNMKSLDEDLVDKLKVYREYDGGKNLLRRSLTKLLPSEIVNGKKRGFSSPDESWYRGERLNYVKSTLLDRNACINDFINQNYVERIVGEHTSGKKNWRLLIWSLLCFELWCQIFLNNRSLESFK